MLIDRVLYSLVWESIDLAADFLCEDGSFVNGEWEALQVEILSQCSRIWSEVKDVLCNDSPEGHMPQSVDEIDTVDTKDVLSYSFRAIHESR